MDVAQDLKEQLRNVVADGDYGMTLCTGEACVVHTTKGPKSVEAGCREVAVFAFSAAGPVSSLVGPRMTICYHDDIR